MEGHKRNVCSYCSYSFCNNKKLKSHMKTEHNIDLISKTFPCEHCERVFLKKESLYHHLKTHAQKSEVSIVVIQFKYFIWRPA